MPDEPVLLVEREEHVVTLCINLPSKRNFLTLECLKAIEEALAGLTEDSAVRVLVLRGAGDRAFSSGYNIEALRHVEHDLTAVDAGETLPLEKTLQAIEQFPRPVIAMLNGDAFGGGCELAMACDLRIAAAHARMGMPPAKLGLVYPYPGYRRFAAVLGLARALELFLTADTFDSRACLQMGLVHHVIPGEELATFTYDLARRIARNAPFSLAGTKRVLRTIAGGATLGRAEERALHALFHASLKRRDIAEGIAAFAEKRTPVFTGE